ncbi:MAG: hypothetical protein ACW98X_27615 [Promethearchaeota archaeon]|jgi:hypothetical protein
MTTGEYNPYSEWWIKEMLKLTKKEMVRVLQNALIQKCCYIEQLEKDIKHLEHGLNNIIVRADFHITKCQLKKIDDSDMLAVSKIAQETLIPPISLVNKYAEGDVK